MSIKNTENSYGNVAKAFHWIMFLILTGLVIVGFVMGDLPSETPEDASFKFGLYDQHKSFGLLILILVIFRLGWRMMNPVPKLPDVASRLEALSAHGMHMLLYILMFAMPISGWMMSTFGGHPVKFFGIQLPALAEKDKTLGGFFHEAHEILGFLLIAAFVVHVVAALYHHFVKKDDILLRMSLHPAKKD